MKNTFLVLKFSLILLCIVAIFACSKKMSDNTAFTPNPSVGGKTFLALGDSYTIGQSVAVNERFPALTETILKTQGILTADPDYIAVTGWTTQDLLNAIGQANPPQSYDIVTLLIGVNNQYQGKSLNEYSLQFNTLLQDAIKFAGNRKDHVFVLSIPDYSVTPFAQGSDTAKIASQINAFNKTNLTISQNYGVNYLDITPISRQAKNDGSLIASDGLHPSGVQYQKWAELLAPMIKAILK